MCNHKDIFQNKFVNSNLSPIHEINTRFTEASNKGMSPRPKDIKNNIKNISKKEGE